MSNQHHHHHHSDNSKHDHAHTDAHPDVTEENAKFFNKIAGEEAKAANFVNFVTSKYLSRVNFVNKDVLDFACGGGHLALNIYSSKFGKAKSVTGVDISQGMLEKFHEKIKKANIDESNLQVLLIKNLEDAMGLNGPLHGKDFDIITCSAAYHHFDDPNKITQLLSKLLRPNGLLVIADMFENDDEETAEIPQDVKHVIPHHFGFKETKIKSILQGGGIDNFKPTGLKFQSWDFVGEVDVVGTTMKIGFAKAIKN